MFKKETIVNKLKKSGIELGADNSAVNSSGKYLIKIRPNGRDEPGAFWYIVIENLRDPSRIEEDYFSSYFPKTIKAAIAAFQRG